MQPRIIGFSGRKGSGKDTCVNVVSGYLHDNHLVTRNSRLGLYGFADPLKKTCQQFFGLTHEQCYGTDEQKNSFTEILWDNFPDQSLVSGDKVGRYMTAREVLQFYGTNIIRRMHVDAHVNATIKQIREDNPRFALFVDVRFPNEVEAVQKNNGVVIRLTRCPYVEDVHESETSLDPERYNWENFDYIVDNTNMTLKDQEKYITTLVENIIHNR